MHYLSILKTVTAFLSVGSWAVSVNGPTYHGPTDWQSEGTIVPANYSNDLFNDIGFVLRGNTTTGEEFNLWIFIYRQIGVEVVLDNDISQTLMIYGNFTTAQKGMMTDRPFINKGQDIEDYMPIGTIKNTGASNSTNHTWQFQGRVITSDKPNWRVTGTHAGVEVDLEMSQLGDFFYHAGKFSDRETDCLNTEPECNGNAGGIVHVTVTGTITDTAANKTLVIDEGYGVHERIMQTGYVPERIGYMGGRGANWVHGWSKDLSYFFFNTDAGPTSTAMVNVDNKTLTSSGTNVSGIAEIGQWLDPKTRQLNPYQWYVWADFPEGRLESTASAYSRGYYYWVRDGGILLVHQYILDSNTTWTRADGSTVERSQRGFQEYMRTLYTQPTKE